MTLKDELPGLLVLYANVEKITSEDENLDQKTKTNTNWIDVPRVKVDM